MANYNLTTQEISSSFQQLMQYDRDTGSLYDGTGSLITNIDVTSSQALTASYAENVLDPTWDNIQDKPSGLVSGSSQIILQDTTGDLSGSRINEAVALATTASHALTASYAENSQQIDTGSFATTGSNTFTGNNTFDGQVILNNTLETFSGNITNYGGRIQGIAHGFENGSSPFTGSFVGDGSGLSNVTASNGGVTSIIAGTNIVIDQGEGDVTISAAVSASTEWDNIVNKPAGLVSGSEQIDLTQTTGNITSSRIDGTVVSASFADNGGVTSIIAGTNISIDQGQGDVTISSTGGGDSTDTGSLLNNASADFSITTFTRGDGTTFDVDTTPRRVIETVKNKDVNLLKGTPVYVSGSTGNELHVYQADAGDITKVPATFVLDADLDTDESGVGILSGFINGVNTSAFAEGANIYLAVGGGYTDVQPTGSAYIQKLGNVVRSEINGSGVISGAGRVNALPNIQDGYGWFGNSDGVAEAQSTASFAKTDLSNTFTQNQTITGSLEVTQAVVSTQVEVSEAVITSTIESTSGTITLGNNTVISGSVNVQTGNPLVATQLQAEESVITPEIASSTGTTTVGNNIVISGSVNVASGNPLTATQIQAEESVITPVLESTTGTIDVPSSIDMSSGPNGLFVNNPNGSIQAGQLVSPVTVTQEIESDTGTISVLSNINFGAKITSDVHTLGISNNTASIDFNNPQMQVLELPASGDTRIETSNVSNGQVVNILVKATGTGTVTLSDTILQPSGSSYQATAVNGGRDILTITSFDNSSTSETYLVNIVNLV